RVQRFVWRSIFAGCVISVVFSIASIPIFHFLGTPLTYPLIHIAGNATVMGSSLGAFLGARLATALIAAPLLYVILVLLCERFAKPTRRLVIAAGIFALVFAIGDEYLAQRAMNSGWGDRDDRRMVDNPQWVLIRSCLSELAGGEHVNLVVHYPPEYGDDFK